MLIRAEGFQKIVEVGGSS